MERLQHNVLITHIGAALWRHSCVTILRTLNGMRILKANEEIYLFYRRFNRDHFTRVTLATHLHLSGYDASRCPQAIPQSQLWWRHTFFLQTHKFIKIFDRLPLRIWRSNSLVSRFVFLYSWICDDCIASGLNAYQNGTIIPPAVGFKVGLLVYRTYIFILF